MSIASAPRVSVLIIVKDEPEIEKSLESLEIQCKEIKAECIVVDASEHRLDSIRAKHPWVHWIDYQQPVGRRVTIAHQRNVAVATASSSVLLFCDAGGIPNLNWVRDLSRPLLEGRRQLVGGPIFYTSKAATARFDNLQEDGEVLRVSTTANIGFTRLAFDCVKGFNENLNYGSDADFIWRLEAEGIRHTSVKSAQMGLDHGSRGRELKRSWEYGKALSTLFRLHNDKRREKFRTNPETWVYRLLIMTWVGALILVLVSPLLVLLPFVTNCMLLIKNIKTPHPFRVVLRHYLLSFGFIYQSIASKWKHINHSFFLNFSPKVGVYTFALTEAVDQVSKPVQRTISVLIIVKDEPEIEKSLESLEIQCKEIKAECIVVDASEHRLDSIRAKHPWVHWIDYQQPVGQKFTIPQQRNIAVARSNGEILAFCDASGEPCKSWLKALVEPILEGRAEITGGPVVISSQASPDFGFNNQAYGSEIMLPTTANMAFTRDAFDLARGFDETLPSGEDAAFVWTLNRNNIHQFATPSAIMGLDHGTSRREIIRAWRYGKATSSLLHKFPEQRKIKQSSNPEIIIYPILLLIMLSGFAFLLVNLKASIAINLSLIATYCLLAFKNRKTRRPWFGLVFKTIHAFSMCREILRRKIFHRSKYGVISYPADGSRYLVELDKALTKSNFRVDQFYQLSSSATINTLLLPITPFLMRLHGYKILHIHWLFQFKLHWQVSRKWKYLMSQWFAFWMFTIKIFRIKIIWTVHDPLPHEIIFDNDVAKIQVLIKNCSSLIALNRDSLQHLENIDKKPRIVLIPEGPLIMPTTNGRLEFRNHLKVTPSKRLIVLVGFLSSYKGVTTLLEGAFDLPSNFAIRLAGKANAQYQKDLESILLKLKSKNIDVDISFARLTDDEYGGYLKSADFVCIPFKEINNSGSINSALCSGVPVIIPNIASLDWVPKAARLDIPYDSNGKFDFKELFRSLELLSMTEHETMRKGALNWASTLSWQDVANQHIDLYKKVGGENE